MPQPIRRGSVVVWDMQNIDRAFEVLSGDAEDASPWRGVSLTRQ